MLAVNAPALMNGEIHMADRPKEQARKHETRGHEQAGKKSHPLLIGG
jgi:hypothetical protein